MRSFLRSACWSGVRFRSSMATPVRVLSSDGAEASFVLQEGCRFVLGDSSDFPKGNQFGPTIMVIYVGALRVKEEIENKSVP